MADADPSDPENVGHITTVKYICQVVQNIV